MKSSVAESSHPSHGNIQDPPPGSCYSDNPQADGRRPGALPLFAASFWLKLVPAEGWLAGLLLGIAVSCVVFSIIAANWVNHTSLLYTCGALGLICGFGVAKIRYVPQVFLHITTFLLGCWLALFFTGQALHEPSFALVENLRSLLVTGIVPVLDARNEANFLFYLSFLCFFLGYLGSWLIYHAHLPLLVVLAYMSIFLINLNYVKQDYIFLTIVFAGSLALLVARIQLVNQLASWGSEGLYTDRSWLRMITGRFMRFATLFVVLSLLASWIMPIMDQTRQGVQLWNNLDNAWGNLSHGNFSLANPQNLFQPYQEPASFFGDKLSITGSVNLPTGMVLKYTSNETNPHYLEGFTFDNFDGHTWISLATNSKVFVPANTDISQGDNSGPSRSVQTNVAMVNPPGGKTPFIFGPSEPAQFNVPVNVSSIEYSPLVGAWSQQQPFTKDEQYKVTSNVSMATPEQLSQIALPQDDPGTWEQDINYTTLENYYLQLPKFTPAEKHTILATTQNWTRGATSTYAALHQLEAHLSDPTRFTYSTTNPPVPDNQDAVSWLLQTRRGYCTYYATAMTVMARLLKIPTRIVNGFTQGHFNSSLQAWEVDGSDAHSWVQAYIPSFGWVDFDPTPGYLVERPTKTSNSPSAVPTPAGSHSHAAATPAPKKQSPKDLRQSGSTQQNSAAAQGHNDPTLLIGMSLGLTICVFGLLLFMGLAYWWRNLYKNMPFVTRMYWRFSWLAALVGLAPQKWQTPYEYSQMIGQKTNADPAPLWHLTELFVRERWAGSHQTPVQEAEHLWPHLRRLALSLIFKRKRGG